MHRENTIIIGAGPCGMSCAIELQKKGINPLLIEKENIVNTIYQFPTHQVFFSTSEKLEIGGLPFVTEKQKPNRLQALAYYQMVAERKQLRIHSFEEAIDIKHHGNAFKVITKNQFNKIIHYETSHVIIATGYYDQPNLLGVEGEDLDKVTHYFKEAQPYFGKDVVIVGGKNSAVDAAIELQKAGANVTVLYRGSDYSPSVKPWILPLFDSLIRHEKITMVFNAQVTKITDKKVYYTVDHQNKTIKNDFVFAMTGYQPNVSFLKQAGVEVDKLTGVPKYDESTYETNIPGLYVAGVVTAGFNNNAIFIENGRFHGEHIARSILNKK